MRGSACFARRFSAPRRKLLHPQNFRRYEMLHNPFCGVRMPNNVRLPISRA